MELYRIRNWSTLFENNRTRELKRLDWVPVPNKMELGYLTFVDHPNGAAHLGAWLAILEIASRRFPKELRGTLPHDDAGISHALAKISRLPAPLFDEVIPRLIKLQWIEHFAEISQGDAIISQAPAGKPALKGIEENGIEGKRTEVVCGGNFEPFWERWCSLTGRRQHEQGARQAWISVVSPELVSAALACLERYGLSRDVAGGAISNPDKWIYDQARDGFRGSWPANSTSENGKSRMDRTMDIVYRNLKVEGKI